MAFAIAQQPRRELEMHGAQFAGLAQGLQRLAEAAPQLITDLRRHVLVVQHLGDVGAQRLLQILVQDYRRGLVAGEEPEGLDVETKPSGVRSAHSCAFAGVGMP